MDSAIYLGLREDESFHTIIIKKEINDYTYIAAVGYAGGQVYEEFYGKFSMGSEESDFITGMYSWSTGSGLWDNKLISLKFNNESEKFDSETEDFQEFMDSEDEKIQWNFISEIGNYIKYGYDEETDMEIDYPEVKDIDKSIFTEYEDSPGQYRTSNWDDQCLEITCSNIWGLSLRFPHVIDNYL